jgi:DNA-binding transcriptional LysR family regulator
VAVVPPLHITGSELARDARHLELSDRNAVRSIGVVWDERRYRSPATELFRQFVIKHGQGLTSS